MASASRKRNVTPASAEIECDCRVLPGTDPEELLGEFRAALGRARRRAGAGRDAARRHALALRTPLRDALAEWIEELEPGALLVPEISSGFTDSHFMREAFGTIAYGFFPLRYTAPELLDTIHAPDERIDVRDLELAVRRSCTASTGSDR